MLDLIAVLHRAVIQGQDGSQAKIDSIEILPSAIIFHCKQVININEIKDKDDLL